MGLPKLILRTVNKYLKGLETRCQSLVTVTVTYEKRKINCIILSIKLSLTTSDLKNAKMNGVASFISFLEDKIKEYLYFRRTMSSLKGISRYWPEFNDLIIIATNQLLLTPRFFDFTIY
jgi:hypothetical protein